MCEVRYHLIFLIIINLTLLLFINQINSLPINAKNDYLYDDDYDYDLIYDQRQKGTENLRINIDGVVLGLPTDNSDTSVDNAADIISELLSIAAGFGGTEDNGNDDDDDQEIEISYISSITTPAPTFESVSITTVETPVVPEVVAVNKEPTNNEENPITINKPNSVMNVEIVQQPTDDKKPEDNSVTQDKEKNEKSIVVQRHSTNNINSTFKRRNNSRNKSRLMSLLKPLFQRRSSK